MATDIILTKADELEPGGRAGARAMGHSPLHNVLRVLASLRLTVALFALAIAIVFFGTLAQVNQDINAVIGQYFRTPVAWVEFRIFLPHSWATGDHFLSDFVRWLVDKGFYFPGGWLIGFAMCVNLLAAHLVRFKVQAKGARLAVGVVALAAAIGLTWWIIDHTSLHGGAIDQTASPEFADRLWKGFLAVALGLIVTGVYRLATTWGQNRTAWWLMLAGVVVVGTAWAWAVGVLVEFGMKPDPSSMRILWQLLLGGVAGLAVYAACVVIFKQRAGIVVIHAGVALMMANELYVGLTNVESRMRLQEGQALNYSEDIRAYELAVVDPSDPKTDSVTIIPKSLITQDAVIKDERLPFDIQIAQFIQNADIRPPLFDEKNPATEGFGRSMIAVPLKPGVAADTDGKVDTTAAYIKLLKKGTSESLSTRLVTVLPIGRETVTVDGKKYEVALRFKRIYKPYIVRLNSVRKKDYVGTDTPRDYSSFVDFVDPERHVDFRDKRIYMNNPLRYQGETLYQANFEQVGGVRHSTFSVVTNRAWMIPYVGCMIVVIGLLGHFVSVLSRFLRRRDSDAGVGGDGADGRMGVFLADSVESNGKGGRNGRDRRHHRPAARAAELLPAGSATSGSSGFGSSWFGFVPWIVIALGAAYVVSAAIPPKSSDDSFDYYQFGQLPVMDGGRVKPVDTLAENFLTGLSGHAYYRDQDGRKHTAVQWFLDVVTPPRVGPDGTELPRIGDEHRIFKIDNPDVQQAVHLKPRADGLYSFSEIEEHLKDLRPLVQSAMQLSPDSRSLTDDKILLLGRQYLGYMALQDAFRVPQLPKIPDKAEVERAMKGEKPSEDLVKFVNWKQEIDALRERLQNQSTPMPVPAAGEQTEWQPLYAASEQSLHDLIAKGADHINPALQSWQTMLTAYDAGNVREFNKALADYSNRLASDPPIKDLDVGKIGYEAYFNFVSPFYVALFLYIGGMLLALIGLLGFGSSWGEMLQRCAFWMIVMGLGLTAWGLVARIQISGRPPVTSLYSAALFIGFAAVLLMLALEIVYSNGVGNMVAGAAGFIALLIGLLLVSNTDTFAPLEAVLDTQFWLATHVVCITLGYATTFIAGLLAITYVLMDLFTSGLNQPLYGKKWDTTGLRSLFGGERSGTIFIRGTLGKELTRMIYAAVCFAIFFSFFGTVLGGLWADDSWGRFWGWDPKENGALIIVLWNALVLHARWAGIVKDRGLALLAMGGNIAVGWSMFGVNQLSVGLHSYGFTEGVAIALWATVIAHLALIGVAVGVNAGRRPQSAA